MKERVVQWKNELFIITGRYFVHKFNIEILSSRKVKNVIFGDKMTSDSYYYTNSPWNRFASFSFVLFSFAYSCITYFFFTHKHKMDDKWGEKRLFAIFSNADLNVQYFHTVSFSVVDIWFNFLWFDIFRSFFLFVTMQYDAVASVIYVHCLRGAFAQIQFFVFAWGKSFIPRRPFILFSTDFYSHLSYLISGAIRYPSINKSLNFFIS